MNRGYAPWARCRPLARAAGTILVVGRRQADVHRAQDGEHVGCLLYTSMGIHSATSGMGLPSTGSPITFQMRPSVFGPTGIKMCIRDRPRAVVAHALDLAMLGVEHAPGARAARHDQRVLALSLIHI